MWNFMFFRFDEFMNREKTMRLIKFTADKKSSFIQYLRNGILPEGLDREEKKSFKRTALKFTCGDDEGILFYKKTTVLLLRVFSEDEGELKLTKMENTHLRSGHPGRDRLMSLLNDQIYDFNRDEVMAVLRRCPQCMSRNLMNTRPIVTPIRSFSVRERYIFDLIDLRSYAARNDAHKWLLVGLDSFSKFAWTRQLRLKSANLVVREIEKIFLEFGAPIILHTDNGREFVNSEMTSLLERFSVRHVRGRARCPWIQGQVERLNQTLKYSISATCFSENLNFRWVDIHHRITSCYNRMIHTTTRHLPFNIMFGPTPDVSLDRHLDPDVIRTMFTEIESWNNELGPNPDDSSTEYDNWNFEEIAAINNDVTRNSDIAAERMIARRMWANDTVPFEIGQRVVRRIHLDMNTQTRGRALHNQYDDTVFIVTAITNVGLVDLVAETDPDNIHLG